MLSPSLSTPCSGVLRTYGRARSFYVYSPLHPLSGCVTSCTRKSRTGMESRKLENGGYAYLVHDSPLTSPPLSPPRYWTRSMNHRKKDDVGSLHFQAFLKILDGWWRSSASSPRKMRGCAAMPDGGSGAHLLFRGRRATPYLTYGEEPHYLKSGGHRVGPIRCRHDSSSPPAGPTLRTAAGYGGPPSSRFLNTATPQRRESSPTRRPPVLLGGTRLVISSSSFLPRGGDRGAWWWWCGGWRRSE